MGNGINVGCMRTTLDSHVLDNPHLPDTDAYRRDFNFSREECMLSHRARNTTLTKESCYIDGFQGRACLS
jgi:hypothetical protein